MYTENDYYTLPTQDGRFILVIRAKTRNIENPHIVYAKGKHAVLYRNNNPDDTVVLDFLAEETQKLMTENTRAIVVETENDVPVYDYIVEIQLRDKLPVELKEETEESDTAKA